MQKIFMTLLLCVSLAHPLTANQFIYEFTFFEGLFVDSAYFTYFSLALARFLINQLFFI
jgi:hypothetical protein